MEKMINTACLFNIRYLVWNSTLKSLASVIVW